MKKMLLLIIPVLGAIVLGVMYWNSTKEQAEEKEKIVLSAPEQYTPENVSEVLETKYADYEFSEKDNTDPRYQAPENLESYKAIIDENSSLKEGVAEVDEETRQLVADKIAQFLSEIPKKASALNSGTDEVDGKFWQLMEDYLGDRVSPFRGLSVVVLYQPTKLGYYNMATLIDGNQVAYEYLIVSDKEEQLAYVTGRYQKDSETLVVDFATILTDGQIATNEVFGKVPSQDNRGGQ